MFSPYIGRRAAVAWLATLAASVGTMARSALADVAMNKDAFKEGCNSGGHSFVDNRDGSFQCNLSSGAEIKCTSTKGPCTYTPPPKHVTHRPELVSVLGHLEIISADASTRDPLVTAGTLLAAPELGMTLVVVAAEPAPAKRRTKRRR